MWCVVFLQCSEIKVTVFRFSNLSSEIHKYRPSSSYHAVPSSYLSGSFKCSSLLSCKDPRVQLSICVPISLSRIHLTSSLYLCPADCFQEILFEQAGNSHCNKLAFLHISSDISAPWAHESNSLDVSKANGMLTSHAKRIFSDNGTCFGTNKRCSNRSHLHQCFIKALRFLLAWLLCFYTETPRIFFRKAIFATSPIVPAVTIHTLPWKMRVATCPLSFSMASSLVLFLFGHGVETSNLGDVSAQKLCQASGDFSLEQVGIDVSAPCTHDSNSIDVYTATHAKGSRKVQEDR